MKLSWAYLLQLVSASLFFQSAAAAPIADALAATVEERAIQERHEDGYAWFIDDDEKTRLSELLGIDFGATGINRILLSGPKQKCRGCGKYTGFDDLVHNALEDNIHGKDLMIKVIEARGADVSHPHKIRCSGAGCGLLHPRVEYWIATGQRWLITGPPDEEA